MFFFSCEKNDSTSSTQDLIVGQWKKELEIVEGVNCANHCLYESCDSLDFNIWYSNDFCQEISILSDGTAKLTYQFFDSLFHTNWVVQNDSLIIWGPNDTIFSDFMFNGEIYTHALPVGEDIRSKILSLNTVRLKLADDSLNTWYIRQ